MKRTLFFITVALLNISVSFAQTCPCIKTKIIGNDPNASFKHNNMVKAMNDTTIAIGRLISLKTISCIGKATWHISGSNHEIINLNVSPIINTEFVVESRLEGCPSVYDTVTVYVSKNIDLAAVDVLIEYPNPTGSEIIINSGSILLNTIELTDDKGKSIQTVIPSGKSIHTINISNRQSGVYFLKIRTANGNVYTKKILKN